jgi:hypothetical protein
LLRRKNLKKRFNIIFCGITDSRYAAFFASLIEVAGVFHEQQAPFGSQTFRLVDKIEGTEAFIGGAEGCILRRHVYLGDYRDFGYLPLDAFSPIFPYHSYIGTLANVVEGPGGADTGSSRQEEIGTVTVALLLANTARREHRRPQKPPQPSLCEDNLGR